MRLSTELTELLTVALRTRVNSITELADSTGRAPQEVRAGIQSLQANGYLEMNDDTIAYRRPEMPVTDMAQETLASAIDRLKRTADDIDQALESLPALLQAWDTGGTDERTIPGEVSHAQSGPGEAWMLHFARDTPKTCDICMPDLSQLLAAPRDQRVADWTAQSMGALQVRLVVTEADTRKADLAPSLARLTEQGTTIRSHPQPPSFFWVSDHQTAGLPLHWGEPWPHSVLTVRSGPVAEAMAARFDQVWNTSTPFRRNSRNWEPMLRLMNTGMTMEAAAGRLGLAHRTARRRVEEAMTHYGVTSQFALGAAWGRDGKARATV